MNITFCNNQAYPCGCRLHVSGGWGEYSDGITVELCEKHSPLSCPKEDAKKGGYVMSAAGSWIARPNTRAVDAAGMENDVRYALSSGMSERERLQFFMDQAGGVCDA